MNSKYPNLGVALARQYRAAQAPGQRSGRHQRRDDPAERSVRPTRGRLARAR